MSITSPPDFDRIAAGWYGFRHHTIFKTELTEMAGRWGGGRLLNAGCGHGADFLPFTDGYELYGIDISSEMLKYADKYARKHRFEAKLIQADMRALPFPDGFFDYAIAVASLHHIKGRDDQLKALAEIKRVLKPGGEAFITVWNATQPRFWFKRRDTLIPWKQGGEIIRRFYHLFTYGEIEKLARTAGFTILSSRPEARYRRPFKWFSRNICLLLKKEL
ncbi:class I SAM-dependent methyltransferase [Dehalogenimonas sp. THU2]|uniref:class I SAM-dependent methyltransferase n=1 Tax=Dehalogenimonas sp. THU2 TaxID=3151121 RepID=UPI0032188661